MQTLFGPVAMAMLGAMLGEWTPALALALPNVGVRASR